MLRLAFIIKEVLCAAIFTVPILLILNKTHFRSAGQTLRYLVFSLYLSAIYALVGMPNITYMRLELNLNLLPIVGMLNDLKNSFLNVLLFIPMGFLLPYLSEYFRGGGKRTILTGLAVSVVIELLQVLTYRASDINDVITNTAGTAAGYILSKWMYRCFPGVFPKEADGKTLWIIVALTLLVMFFAQPFVVALL